MKVALDTTLRESVSKSCFRDVVLSKESPGRSGLRQFLAMPGQTREQAARDIVRLFGVNRFPFLSTELRQLRNQQQDLTNSTTTTAIQNLNSTPIRRYWPTVRASPELMLLAPVHTIFCRPRTPVNFMMDIDCPHENPQETADPAKIEDQVLGFCFNAMRAAFARHGLSPQRTAVLSGSGLSPDGRLKPYVSIHIHMDLRDSAGIGAAFGDSVSMGNFVRGEVFPELNRLGASGGAGSAKLAARVRESIDLAPFLTSLGGSLRVYGAPKLNGTRPMKLLRPMVGSACSTALYAMGAQRGAPGGPTMRLLADGEDAATGSGGRAEELTAEEEAEQADNELSPSDMMKGLRPIELEAMALSLGTPDYTAPQPLRLLYFNSKNGSSSAAPGSNGGFLGNKDGGAASGQSNHPVVHFDTLPLRVRNQLDPSCRDVPFPLQSATPETFAYCAVIIAPMIPSVHAKPYRNWVSVALSLTEIAALCNKDNKHPELEERLQQAFISFSDRAPNYEHAACTKLWRKMMWRKTQRKTRALTASDARDAYAVLVNWLRKPPPNDVY